MAVKCYSHLVTTHTSLVINKGNTTQLTIPKAVYTHIGKYIQTQYTHRKWIKVASQIV